MSTASLEYPIEDLAAIEESTRRHVEQWRDEEGNLIMILHAIQNEYGYVPREIAMELARLLEINLARIYEVITFYHYFKLTPPGRHTVAVCIGTACYLKGSANILQEWVDRLGIAPGQTTSDRAFHLETVRCIGCCGMSPAYLVDGKAQGRAKREDVAHLHAATEGNPR